MAQYRTHSLLNIFVALPPLVAVGILFFKLPMSLIMMGGGVFVYGTLFMSPDVDLAYNIKWLSVRGLLSFPFRTYAKVFRHRGLSHSVLFGTLTRLAWLGLYVTAAVFIYYQCLPTKKSVLSFYMVYRLQLIAAFVGLFLADLCHILVDKVSDG